MGVLLASKIPHTINTFFDYLDPPLNRTFFFDPIIPEDINLEISILQENKAHGLYSSPVRLLKLAKRVTSVPLATIFNQEIPHRIYLPQNEQVDRNSAKIRHYVPRRVLLSVYNSLIVPYLTYGICGWGNCALTFQRKIVTLQKRALRLIYFSKSKEHTAPFFFKSNCLPLPSIFFTDCSYFFV